MKNVSFSPMNALIRGTAAAIEKALQACGLPEYTLDPSSTYDPERVDAEDRSLKEARAVFEMFNEVYMTTKDMPLGKLPQIKFLLLGDGGSEYEFDGTYAVYKDFGETAPSAALHFETRVGPHMEEFDGQADVLENVWNSFLDHEWEYEFEDYSCGEYVPYRFKGKKAKELIAKWQDDVRFRPEADETLERDLAAAVKKGVPARKVRTVIKPVTVFLSNEDWEQIRKGAEGKTAAEACAFRDPAWKLCVEIIDRPDAIELTVTDTAAQTVIRQRGEMGARPAVRTENLALKQGIPAAGAERILPDSPLRDTAAAAGLMELLKNRLGPDVLKDADPEKSGILLRWNGGDAELRSVSRYERPELCCRQADGSLKMDRPYADEVSIGMMMPFMSHEDKLREAELGNAGCMFAVAMDYFEGNDVEPDPAQAAAWMERLAQTGDAAAQLNIAQFYAEGYGVPRDIGRAAEWMRKARDQDEPEAEEYLELYERLLDAMPGAERGDAAAAAKCAELFLQLGDGLDWMDPKEDFALACRYAKASAEQGCPEGVRLLEACRKRGAVESTARDD